MDNWAWEELVAQVEEHGRGEVKFYLLDSGGEDGNDLELAIDDIKYEDGEIKVVLG